MTIPEASQLVLEAGAMGKGGEIFIFDMGESIKIFDLAKNMIKLSGLNYPDDIDIKITGLRPGEKLYEELLANGENTIPTYHNKIMISKTREFSYNAVIEAMKKADSTDPAKFGPEIFNVSFTGATGKVEFDAKGDRKGAEVTIFRMKDGKIAPVAIVKEGVSTPFGAAPAAAMAEPKKEEKKK
jgi:hypothetical protein